MANSNGRQTAYRSAVTGKFITRKQAERNPRETVKESNPKPKRK